MIASLMSASSGLVIAEVSPLAIAMARNGPLMPSRSGSPKLMFDAEDALFQRLRRIAGEDGNLALQDDRPGIQVLVHKMNSGAADRFAGLQGLLLGAETREFWQQRWVDVEDSVRERVDERRAQQAHESGQTYQADVALLQLLYQRAVVVFARRERFVVEDQGLDVGRARMIEAGRIGLVRNHDGDRGIEAFLFDRLDDRLEIRSPPGDQDAEFSIHDSTIFVADRSDNATKVRVPFVHPPVGVVGAPITNRFS